MKIYYQNATWRVTNYGLEHKNGKYPIAKKALRREPGAHTWSQHLAEKNWVNIADFDEAYSCALAHHFPIKPVKAPIKRRI